MPSDRRTDFRRERDRSAGCRRDNRMAAPCCHQCSASASRSDCALRAASGAPAASRSVAAAPRAPARAQLAASMAARSRRQSFRLLRPLLRRRGRAPRAAQLTRALSRNPHRRPTSSRPGEAPPLPLRLVIGNRNGIPAFSPPALAFASLGLRCCPPHAPADHRRRLL